jgi:uncharacterized protein
MRTLLLVLTSLVLLGAASARADEASHRKAVLELFQQMDMAKVMNAGIDASLKAQIQANPGLARFEAKMRAFLAKYMSWESMRDDYTALYMKAFSEDELKQLIAFYKTPVGRKALHELPSLMQQGAQLGMDRVQAHMGELQAMLQEPAPAQPAAPAKPSKPAK